jgi:hypothetical protein
MNTTTERAYRRWQRLADRGYGEHTQYQDLQRIDARIRHARDEYERLVLAGTNRGPSAGRHA